MEILHFVNFIFLVMHARILEKKAVSSLKKFKKVKKKIKKKIYF